MRGKINDTFTLFDSNEAANGPIREIDRNDARTEGAFQERTELNTWEGTDANAETDLGFANSPTMSDNALGDSEDDHDAPLRALALYEIPAGVTLENPCAYTENHERGSSSTGSSLNWWCKIASATPPLIDDFKKINTLGFMELEKEKILKWGARAFYFSKKKFPKGSRGDPLKIVEQLGCKNGSYRNMCDESRRVARTLTRGIFSLGRTDTNDFLFKLVPPQRKKEQTMRMRCQRAYVDRHTKHGSGGTSTDNGLNPHKYTPAA